MQWNVDELAAAVVGRRIVSAKRNSSGLMLLLDDGTEVVVANTTDCCAYTELDEFFLDPKSVDHVILGVGTTEEFDVWHVFADWGDVLRLELGWSPGNLGGYMFGFDIRVRTPKHAAPR